MNNIVFIVGALIVVFLIVGNIIYSNKMKKAVLAAKPKDNRIYKVFEIIYEGTPYYVIKKFLHFSSSNSYEWDLFGDYTLYKKQSIEEIIQLCDRLNDKHIEELNKKKMTRMLENTSGNIIH